MNNHSLMSTEQLDDMVITSSSIPLNATEQRTLVPCISHVPGEQNVHNGSSGMNHIVVDEDILSNIPLERREVGVYDPHTLLKCIFHYYCVWGRRNAKESALFMLDHSKFGRIFRDCPHLINAKFPRAAIDLIFFKVLKAGERRIKYASFLDALRLVAVGKYPKLPLQQSLPKLVATHLARLPCITDLTNDEELEALFVVE
uniref:Uncharacterized protein AlNc14C231G9292 n=1 Tax=Albugo laibachii Nc14 TaxID=890382 RepID=F0WSF1_9STRA|nr:conserved hypothetical protein [Albugo laibachii Nc14]|eukprot:CCA24272.1 conserved hypothetical protein [Albugo laibachii Nc14]